MVVGDLIFPPKNCGSAALTKVQVENEEKKWPADHADHTDKRDWE
jgi:hypothetical protein